MQPETSGSIDPRSTIAGQPMHWRQIVAIAICVLLCALDGFDVLSISFASPGIVAEWGIDRAALGIVLSMELIGMAVGSFVLGPIADRNGRRRTAIVCLLIMALGMFGAGHAGSVSALAALRLLTGIGIGGMLTCINAMAAEYSNDRWRGAAVAIMAAGYPLGAILGGSVASYLLIDGNWRDVFTFGAIATLAMLPLLYFLAPETVGHMMQTEPEGKLQRVNRSLAALGHAPVSALPPEQPTGPRRISTSRLFDPDLRRITILVTLAYFAHVMTFYYIIKWIPKIVVDMGYEPSSAGGVLVLANVGGLIGALVLSALTLRFGLRALMLGIMLMSAIMVVVFGQGQSDLSGLSIAAGAAGLFTNAGMVGFYALVAASFPTEVRAGGTGFVIGIGRGGAALGPVAAGFLFEAGFGLSGVSILMAMGSLAAMLAIFAMPRQTA